MKFQWTWILSIFLAIIIAVFSVVNVEAVHVNYVFGSAEWPLVLVILSAALLGAAVNGFIALFRAFSTKNKIKELQKEIAEKEATIKQLQQKIEEGKSNSFPEAKKEAASTLLRPDDLNMEQKDDEIIK